MKTTQQGHIVKPSNDTFQIEDLPDVSIKKPQITPRQIIRAIADSTLKTFPWLFLFILLFPIYPDNERLTRMFIEPSVPMIANQWIVFSFKSALLIGICLALLLGFMRNNRISPASASAHKKEQHS
jgi:hypothetical protein